MMMIVNSLLSPEMFDFVIDTFERLEFTDGSATASEAAKSIKKNKIATGGLLSADLPDNVSAGLAGLATVQRTIAKALMNRDDVQAWARPKALIAMQIACYETGDGYGWHVDNALMNGIRTDLSFTYFINDGLSYDGGALEFDGHSIKLASNSVVIYQANKLHRVTPVTGGTRKVALGWIESYIRSHERRKLLFDLDGIRSELFAKNGRTSEHEKLTQIEMNLLRMWVE
jgi:PKHD-type hydroxylase